MGEQVRRAWRARRRGCRGNGAPGDQREGPGGGVFGGASFERLGGVESALGPADGVSVSVSATPPASRESRATQRDRADLRRLEERRDALMARKRRLRELIVARTESEASRVARPKRRAVDAANVADVAPPPPVSLI